MTNMVIVYKKTWKVKNSAYISTRGMNLCMGGIQLTFPNGGPSGQAGGGEGPS